MMKDGHAEGENVRVLLISGGVESLYLYYKYQNVFDKLIFVDYNQPVRENEKKVLDDLQIDYETLILHGLPQEDNGYVWGRNIEIILQLRKLFINKRLVIYLGVNAEDMTRSNTPLFYRKVEDVMNESYTGGIRIVMPLENMNKHDIGIELKKMLPKKITPWSCDVPGEKQCGNCVSCKQGKASEVFNIW